MQNMLAKTRFYYTAYNRSGLHQQARYGDAEYVGESLASKTASGDVEQFGKLALLKMPESMGL